MTHVIDKNICISCGTCEAVCPNAAPSFGGDAYVIDPEKCNDCKTCVENCPVNAISKKE